jgi:hypothetical protein
VPLDGAAEGTMASPVSQLSKPSECDTLSIDWASEWRLLESRVKEGRLMSVVRDVTGRTTCRRESRNDLSECEDREENVGEGSAASIVVLEWVESKNKGLGGVRISEMTESRGPDMVTF